MKQINIVLYENRIYMQRYRHIYIYAYNVMLYMQRHTSMHITHSFFFYLEKINSWVHAMQYLYEFEKHILVYLQVKKTLLHLHLL